jgi:tetratricopeptide (TPR) repeat protein
LLLTLGPAASAQQPSRELQNLQETTRDLHQAGGYDEALDYAQRALQLVMREFGPEHEQTSIQTYSLGLISERAGQAGGGRALLYADPAPCTRSCTAPRSPSVAVALENLGGVYVKLKRHDAAEPLFQRALKIRQDTIGPNHAFSATGTPTSARCIWRAATGPAALTSYDRRSACGRPGHLVHDHQVDRRRGHPPASRHVRRPVPGRLADAR